MERCVLSPKLYNKKHLYKQKGKKMSIDLEKKIDDVLKQFKIELKASRVVDEAGNVNDKKAFTKLIDHAIKRLNDLEPLIANEAGIVTDRYGAGILNANIQLLQDMKQRNSLNLDATPESLRRGAEKEEGRLSTQHGWFAGIKKIFGKMKSTPQNEHDSR